MEVQEVCALECACGGLLVPSGNHYLCADCGARFCAECGSDIIHEGGCYFCLGCAASSCEMG